MIGVKYDNNINNDVGENTPLNDLTVDEPSGSAEVNDLLHEEMINFNHIYDFGKLGDYFMQNSFLVFAQNYSGKSYDDATGSSVETSDKNLIFLSLSSGIGTKTKTVTFMTKVHYDSVRIAGDELMTVTGLEVNYARPYNENVTWDTKWKYQNKDIIADNDGDSSYIELNLGVKRVDPKTNNIFGANMGISQERANVAANTDNDSMNIKAFYTKELLTVRDGIHYE